MTIYPIMEALVTSRPIGPTFIMPDGSVHGMGQGGSPAPDRAAIERFEGMKQQLEDQLGRLQAELHGHKRDLAKAKLTVEGGVTSADRRKAAADISRLEGLIASANRGLDRIAVDIHGVETRLSELRSRRADARDDLNARKQRLLAAIGELETERQHAAAKADSCRTLAERYIQEQGSLNARTDDGAADRQSRVAKTIAVARAGIREHSARAEAIERDLASLEDALDGVEAQLKAMDGRAAEAVEEPEQVAERSTEGG